jgi:hypothetical protein
MLERRQEHIGTVPQLFMHLKENWCMLSGPNRDDVSGGQRKLHTEELYGFCC